MYLRFAVFDAFGWRRLNRVYTQIVTQTVARVETVVVLQHYKIKLLFFISFIKINQMQCYENKTYEIHINITLHWAIPCKLFLFFIYLLFCFT